jgi:hypothetical protein
VSSLNKEGNHLPKFNVGGWAYLEPWANN